ncbi:MAG: hypothetical protein WAM79_04065, partial [Candidatus Sulfotelmatobacter sp.]
NISLINRRHYLPRLLLILSSKRHMQKLPQRFEDVDRVTPYQGRVARQPLVKHHDPDGPGNNEQVFVQTADMSGAAMPGDLIFLYSAEPRTVEVRIQIYGTSVLL